MMCTIKLLKQKSPERAIFGIMRLWISSGEVILCYGVSALAFLIAGRVAQMMAAK